MSFLQPQTSTSTSITTPFSTNHQLSFMEADPADHIKVSCFYQVDHSKLPPKFPDHLKSIRIVMVNDKTRMRVSLRFPSVYSLQSYFSEINCTKPDAKKVPALDQKYTIGSEIAAEALYRRISPQELSQKKNLWNFWAVPSISSVSGPSNNFRFKNSESLCSALKGIGMVKWGQRRQVRYLARHVEDKRDLLLSKGKEEEEEEVVLVEEEEEGKADELVESEESEGDDVKEETEIVNRKRKKNHGSSSNWSTPKRKMPKREKKNQQIVVYNRQKKKLKVIKNSINRWSAERYKLAEVNMLKIMKEQGAVFGKPILRPELRTQARRLIGDTGLLDHLLKHMAGKVAPGGEERFRRRHNAEGSMEYWLEKANLVDIRKEAGVQDPYWIPPPGWVTGDNPTQDPICANQIKELKNQIAKMQKDMKELASKKHEEELAIVTAPVTSVGSHNIELHNLLTPLKEMYIDLVNKKAKIERQMTEISQSLCEMEKEMGNLKTRIEEPNRKESIERTAPIGLPKSTAITGPERKRKEVMQQMKEATESGEAGSNETPPTEDKAAKIERLKSGFRMCKPQGTFLWPNMAFTSPERQVVVHFEDLFSVSTPPSVSSKSATQPHLLPTPVQHHGSVPTSPVKPLTEKGPVTIALPKAVTRPIPSPREVYSTHNENSSISSTTSTVCTSATTKTTLINLNEPPSNQLDNGVYGSQQSHGQTSSYLVTYQRRSQQTMSTNTAMPCLSPAKERKGLWERGDQGKEMIKHPEQQQQGSCSSSTSSLLPVGVGTWLALATSKPSSDNSKSKRG